MAVMNKIMKVGNKVGVALYQRTNGRVGGKAKGGIPVLLLTVNGRKTGTPHTTPVGYFEHDGSYLVVGSAGGMSGTHNGSAISRRPTRHKSGSATEPSPQTYEQ